MKIMIMGRFERNEEFAVYAQELIEMGHTITSRWMFPEYHFPLPEGAVRYDEKGFSDIHAEYAEKGANIDMEDTLNAEVEVFFSEDPTIGWVRGARHVEFGMAMGFDIAVNLISTLTGIPLDLFRSRGVLTKRMIVVGPRENIYHCLSDAVEVYPDWESAKAAIGNATSAYLTLPDAPVLVDPRGNEL